MESPNYYGVLYVVVFILVTPVFLNSVAVFVGSDSSIFFAFVLTTLTRASS